MDDWLSQLTPGERAEWDQFTAFQHEHTIKAIDSSAFVISLLPGEDGADVKFAVELGLALMLGKPLVLIALPGGRVPYRLRKAADMVIEADLGTEEGQAIAARAIRAFTGKLNPDTQAARARAVTRRTQTQRKRKRR
jgi:nucleoside 2-deoxyribosyltransferase